MSAADDILFKQPESHHLGDCPICCLPLPLGASYGFKYGFTLNSCCSKYVCNGCKWANAMLEYEGRLQFKCIFCRTVGIQNEAESIERMMKRIEANDPVAMCRMGVKRMQEDDYKAAFEYMARAAALGDAGAHYGLSILYEEGVGVEKDEKKELHHLEEAAIAGHLDARHYLGNKEVGRSRMDRAAKHFIIAAKLGYEKSLKKVKSLYEAGHVSKDDFSAALRGYQAAVAAMESPQREEFREFGE